MLGWFTRNFKQEALAIPRPLYSLEQENQILHDMVREIALERNAYRVNNQRLSDENERLRRKLESKNDQRI